MQLAIHINKEKGANSGILFAFRNLGHANSLSCDKNARFLIIGYFAPYKMMTASKSGKKREYKRKGNYIDEVLQKINFMACVRFDGDWRYIR